MSIPFNPITITIGKNSLPSFISLHIDQRIGAHHEFKMAVELESGGEQICAQYQRQQRVARRKHRR